MLFLLIYILLSLSTSYNIIVSKNPTNVYIHLVKFNEQCNLFHIGISFINSDRTIRYDFSTSQRDNNYITYTNDNYITYNYDNCNNIFDYLKSNSNNNKKTIFWGVSNKSIDEIIIYEKCLQKQYILGFYDCRHYVNKFTDWGLNKPTPIWSLHKLWEIN